MFVTSVTSPVDSSVFRQVVVIFGGREYYVQEEAVFESTVESFRNCAMIIFGSAIWDISGPPAWANPVRIASMKQINVALPSGRGETLSIPESSRVGDLRALAQEAFGQGLLKLVTAKGVLPVQWVASVDSLGNIQLIKPKEIQRLTFEKP